MMATAKRAARRKRLWRAGLAGLAALIIIFACGGRDPLSDGDRHLEGRRYSQAIESYRSYYLDNPYSKEAPEALWRIGNIYALHLKDFKKSVEVLSLLTNRFPDSKPGMAAQLLL